MYASIAPGHPSIRIYHPAHCFSRVLFFPDPPSRHHLPFDRLMALSKAEGRCCSRKEVRLGGRILSIPVQYPNATYLITNTDTDHGHETHGHGHETVTRESMSKFKVGNSGKTGSERAREHGCESEMVWIRRKEEKVMNPGRWSDIP